MLVKLTERLFSYKEHAAVAHVHLVRYLLPSLAEYEIRFDNAALLAVENAYVLQRFKLCVNCAVDLMIDLALQLFKLLDHFLGVAVAMSRSCDYSVQPFYVLKLCGYLNFKMSCSFQHSHYVGHLISSFQIRSCFSCFMYILAQISCCCQEENQIFLRFAEKCSVFNVFLTKVLDKNVYR